MLNFKLTYPVTIMDVCGNAIKQEMTIEFKTKNEVINFLNENCDDLTEEQREEFWWITHPEEHPWDYLYDLTTTTLTIDGEEKEAEYIGFITSATPGAYLDPGDTFDDVYKTLGENGKEYVFCTITNKWREYNKNKDRKIWTKNEWEHEVDKVLKSVEPEWISDIPFTI